MNELTVKHIAPLDRYLIDIWKKLEIESNCSVFQSYDWFIHWYKYELRREPNTQVEIYIVNNEKGKVIALFPLQIIKTSVIKLYKFTGGGFSEYNNPLVNNDYLHSNRLYKIWKLIIKSLPYHDAFIIQRNPNIINSPKHNFHLEQIGGIKTGYSYSVSTNKYTKLGDLFKDVSSRMLKDNNRYKRRLKESGELTYKVYNSEKEYNNIFKIISLSLEKKVQKMGIPFTKKIFARLNFYNDFYQYSNKEVDDKNSNMKSHLLSINLDEKILAACWGITYKNTLYYIYPAYMDTPYSKYSPGRLLLEYLITICFDEKINRVDFTLGNESYKFKWAGKENILEEYVFSNTLIGYIYTLYRKSMNIIKSNERLLKLIRRSLSIIERILKVFNKVL